MNSSTNHLVDSMPELSTGYEFVPSDLNRSAKRKLAGKSEAYVSRTSGGKLSKYAAKQRKKKRAEAKKSRKGNRG